MKEKLLGFIVCPTCESSFQLKVDVKENDEIMSGLLICNKCNKNYSIRKGVPSIIADDISEIESDTVEGFGYEWSHFSNIDEKYEQQFLDWLNPVTKDFFKGKNILEGGCGKGRHSLLASKFGAKEVISVDLGSAVYVAFENTRHLNNVHIIHANIFNVPVKKDFFDYTFSIGVLHHMIDPRKGFESLLQHVKPSGYISAWVYGRENNGWIVAIVNPIRKYVTSKLPLPVSKFISYLVCMFLYPILKLIYKPINTKLKFLSKLLCYNSYLFYISKFSFKEIHSIIFDHLLAPIAFYIRRNDFLSWFEDNDLVDINIGWHNENSWRGFGKKK